ncbi:hypothetical protein BJ684DRAFT_19227 [Piptocephalis cylindrospora]|uniref:Uncharacterized protein n=1 Tax=Piptocephalis cylindrospora TaxID=1907219 RepID=A0A4P9Y5R1_9FUNG|nr:hypothetical protein BJ684DRAFT_19227 [Piptocephalis cylindrospora]|eukprot:RKP14366.1 hypothetical protein BJ684DRAFT_19227 [Piptocephalis cylindrospora]
MISSHILIALALGSSALALPSPIYPPDKHYRNKPPQGYQSPPSGNTADPLIHNSIYPPLNHDHQYYQGALYPPPHLPQHNTANRLVQGSAYSPPSHFPLANIYQHHNGAPYPPSHLPQYNTANRFVQGSAYPPVAPSSTDTPDTKKVSSSQSSARPHAKYFRQRHLPKVLFEFKSSEAFERASQEYKDAVLKLTPADESNLHNLTKEKKEGLKVWWSTFEEVISQLSHGGKSLINFEGKFPTDYQYNKRTNADLLSMKALIRHSLKAMYPVYQGLEQVGYFSHSDKNSPPQEIQGMIKKVLDIVGKRLFTEAHYVSSAYPATVIRGHNFQPNPMELLLVQLPLLYHTLKAFSFIEAATKLCINREATSMTWNNISKAKRNYGKSLSIVKLNGFSQDPFISKGERLLNTTEWIDDLVAQGLKAPSGTFPSVLVDHLKTSYHLILKRLIQLIQDVNSAIVRMRIYKDSLKTKINQTIPSFFEEGHR